VILRDLMALGCKVSVADPHAQSLAGTSGVTTAAAAWRGLPRVDGYVVAVPTARHAEVVGELLETGLPIFVEKPLTNDRASAEALAAVGAGRLFVMEKWRHHPGVEALAAIAASGELGALEQVVVRRLQWGYNHRDVDPVWILLPHDVSILHEIMGYGLRPIRASVERHDGAVVGITAELERARIEASIRRAVYDRRLELVCEQGVAWLNDPYDDHISVFRDDGVAGFRNLQGDRRPISTELPLLRELRAFVGFLRGGPPPKASAVEGAATVAVITELRLLAGLD
jgi:predicted dehydrogenase